MFTVYIVDDDLIVLDEIVSTVQWLDNGFTVIGYSCNPQKAIEEISEKKPDLVITDLKMPVLDGIELIIQLKRAEIDCEFIILSAYSSFSESREFFRLGGFDYMLKPFNQSEIEFVFERLTKKLSLKKNQTSNASTNVVPNFTLLTQFIQANYQHKFSLEELGKQFALSPNYICNLFSKHYNTTLTRFITDIRMKKAKESIENGERSFKVIASNCGYSDYYYFCRVFKEYYDMSPTGYAFSLSKEENID